MRWLRGLLLADPGIVLTTLVFGTISLVVSLFDKTGVSQSWLAGVWARLVLGVSGVKVNVEGLEYIDPKGSYIFIANHLSYMDTPVVMAHIPVQFRFLAKNGLFKIPLLGHHLINAGHIPVPREDPRAAVRTLQIAADVVRNKKVSLLIFPEGGRSRAGDLRPFKEGAAYIAIRAQVPLVPVVLIGTREVLPYGDAVVRHGSVTIRILRPIETANLALRDRGPVTEQLHDLILTELQPIGCVHTVPSRATQPAN